MGVITLALVTSGHQAKFDHIPDWVIVAAGVSIGLGTYVGGWRIMRTLGQRLYAWSRLQASRRRRPPA
jgi:PiT family inorganic phosphate transporter